MGDVYVKGVHICKLKESYLGYDLPDKSLINRDRTMVDRDKVDVAIEQMLAQTQSEAVIENLLLSCAKHPESYEGRLRFYPWWDQHWKGVIQRIWGDKVCLTTPDDQTADERAAYLGFVVVNFGTGMNGTLSGTATILPRSRHVNPPAVTKTVPEEALQDVEKIIVDNTKAIMESLLGRKLKINLHVTEELADDTILISKGEDIFLNRRYLTKPVSWLAGKTLHELAHVESGAADCSKEFMNKLGDYITEMVEVATRNWLK
jgi:hypothetical protein